MLNIMEKVKFGQSWTNLFLSFASDVGNSYMRQNLRENISTSNNVDYKKLL